MKPKLTKITVLYQAELEVAINKIVDACAARCRCAYHNGKCWISAENGQRWMVKAGTK